ncbi:MAG: response regulator [Lachnospiraceae bacterium]|nr:response regulator [Lachnospiraceae bacterium]
MGNKMLLTGEKETFLIRVLMKKCTDANVDCGFVRWDVDAINSKWDDTVLLTMYMDAHERPEPKVLRFLIDRMEETGVHMIVIGEREDVQYVLDNVPGDLIYKTIYRPINNDEYIDIVADYCARVDTGEFKKSILIVDDDPNYMSLVRGWLKEDYKVAMANSGLQAIKWLGKNRADLILLDHEMPITTGPQVLEMLRHDDETRNIPVIFLTGKSDKESVMAVVNLKPEGYFLKNIGREELLEKLNRFFMTRKK